MRRDRRYRRDRIVGPPVTAYDTTLITMEELKAAIKKLKRRKAPGPDEIPMKLFKEMQEEELEELRDTLNYWWRNENIPEEILHARVVLIFKKKRHQQI